MVTRRAETVPCAGVTGGVASTLTLELTAVAMETSRAGMFTQVTIVSRVTLALSRHSVTGPVVVTITPQFAVGSVTP